MKRNWEWEWERGGQARPTEKASDNGNVGETGGARKEDTKVRTDRKKGQRDDTPGGGGEIGTQP